LANFICKPDAALLDLNGQGDKITLRQAYENIHIFGAPGSGKTSGSGQTIARGLLRTGAGGLVLCSKPSEVERWQRYAAENGREDSVFIFDREQGFNFIEYAIARYGVEAITNVVGILMRVLDDARKARGKTGNDDSPFWDESIEELLKHAIPVLYSAHGTVTIEGILDFAVNAPVGTEKWKEVAKNIEGNPTAAALQKMAADPLNPLPPAECKRMVSYWMTGEWQKMDERTRGNVLSSLTSRLGLFRHGMLRDCYCGKTTCIPEMMFSGAIIVMAMPVQANETEGRLGQMVFKYMAQLAIEGRNSLPERHRERPVFLWVDEAHRFISVKDEQFLAECRESRCCCVFLSQGLPSYYAALGERETKRVDGLIGKFATQIFHQNGCHYTNEFASKIIGRGLQMRRTVGKNRSTNRSSSKGKSTGASRGSSQGSSRGTSSGESWGVNSSVNRGQSESTGTTRGVNVGGGSSTTVGSSGGSSRSSSDSSRGDKSDSHSYNSGWNRSKSKNSSWSQSTGSSETVSRNSGESVGSNAGRNTGRNESVNAGVNESQNWGMNESESYGETVGESYSEAEQMDNLIEPNYFATALLSGGEHRIVTGLLFRAGARFSNGQNFLLMGFRQ
jgi:TraM recognition site of TraD and TraG